MQCMSSMHAGLSLPFNLVCGLVQTHVDELKNVHASSFFCPWSILLFFSDSLASTLKCNKNKTKTQISSSGHLQPAAMHHFLQFSWFFFLRCCLLFRELPRGTQHVKLAVFSQSTLQHKKGYLEFIQSVVCAPCSKTLGLVRNRRQKREMHLEMYPLCRGHR